jgi:RNA polymerase sigma-70 factor (ECF subfamily)
VTDLTNDDWVAGLRDGSPRRDETVSALRDLLRRGLAKALTGRPSADDAFLDDVTQDAVLKVLDGLPGFRGDSRFTTWAIAIAVRVAFTELRRARWRDVSLDGLADAGVAPEPASAEPPAARVERDELIALMKRVMETDLTERQRLLLAAELDGVPHAELVARLGINRNAYYKLAYDARQRLKRGLLAAGVTEDDVRAAFAITS